VIPSTVHRVPRHTADDVNKQIHRQTEHNVARLADAPPEAIEQRLAELDREWDIERALEANAAVASLIGLALGATVDRSGFYCPQRSRLLATACSSRMVPTGAYLSATGFRTQPEIEKERYALKALRGDFHDVSYYYEARDLPRRLAQSRPSAVRGPTTLRTAPSKPVLRA